MSECYACGLDDKDCTCDDLDDYKCDSHQRYTFADPRED